MPWNDCVLEDWDDCEWADWADCEWDKFSLRDRTAGTRTIRKLPPEASGNWKRPYLEGNPSYIEDSQRYPDLAIANALMKTKGEIPPHMAFKRPYLEGNDNFQKMKYQTPPAGSPYLADLDSAWNALETPQAIIDEEVINPTIEYEWKWVRYFDNSRWIPNSVGGVLPTGGIWFDNRWLPEADPGGDYYVILEVTGSWFRNFRPRKMRIDCDGSAFQYIALFDDISILNPIINVDDYSALTEITIPWAGRDIDGIGFAWSAATPPEPPEPTAVTNIEFYQQVEKGTYLASDERIPRKQISTGAGRATFPHPNPVRGSVRLPRRTNLRTTR